MSPLGGGLAYVFRAELVTEQSSTGEAPQMHQLQSGLSEGAGRKTLHINGINAGLLSHAYIINHISSIHNLWQTNEGFHMLLGFVYTPRKNTAHK